MNFIILFLFLYGVVATPIATTNHNQRIIGGQNATTGQFPYQVAIKLVSNGQHFASGSIISNLWILSCARGTGDNSEYQIRVVVGSIYLNSGGVTHDVLFAIKHPDYVKDQHLNDIGLIRVRGQLVFSELVNSIKLNTQPSATNLLYTISGWGKSKSSIGSFTEVLQYATLKSMFNEDCQKWFPNSIVHYTNICTESTTGQTICLYDRGGPLVYNGEQHGIATWIDSNFCPNEYLNLFTKVASFRDWIKEISNV